MKSKLFLALFTLASGFVFYYIGLSKNEVQQKFRSSVSNTQMQKEQELGDIQDTKLSQKIAEVLSSDDAHAAKKLLNDEALNFQTKNQLIEDLAYFGDESVHLEAKKVLLKKIALEDISFVLSALPTTVHFQMTAQEKRNLVKSLCRFEEVSPHGFESLKLLLNRTKGLESKKNNLNCQKAV